MINVSTPKFVRTLALAAAAALTLAVAPGQRAEAMSLVTPGAAPAAKSTSEGLMTQVRHGGGGFHGGGFHGGGFRGGGFHGGGFRDGGFHGGGFHGFHGGGGWHGRGGWHGGGFRYGGFRHYGGYRLGHVHHRRHFFYGGGYYPYHYGYYHRPYCRIIRTYHGLRRVCGWRHWHRGHHWRRYW